MILPNSIILGDCLDVMSDIPDGSVDMVLCDLPYGTTNCKWDCPIDLSSLWSQYNRIVKDSGAILLFAQTPFDKILGHSNIKNLRYEWIWEKSASTGFLNAKKMPLKAHENILVFYRKTPTYNPQKMDGFPVKKATTNVNVANKGGIYGNLSKKPIYYDGDTTRYPRSVLKFKSDRYKFIGKDSHPTQKPVDLCEYLIKTYSNEGGVVLDNCAGSGTTGVACKKSNRKYILIEKEQKYHDMILKRMNISD